MTKTDKVLICDHTHPHLAEALQDQYQVYCRPDILQWEVDQMLPQIKGIVINSKTKIYAPQIEAMQSGSWIARLGSGLDIIDVAAAKRKNIQVIRTPEANANAVAEHALGMLLSLLHKLHLADRSIRQGLWEREKHRGRELQDMTVGIIGYGQNGSRFAQKLSGMGVNILIYDKYKQRIEGLPRFANTVELQELKKRSDVISFHVPLEEDTFHYFSADFTVGCKEHFYLINTSRGNVVDEEELRARLEDGQVLGACLDVFAKEGQDAEQTDIMRYLTRSEKVILSPHIAGWTFESKKRIAKSIINSLRDARLL